ncbi:MAG: 30S ribosomal protein S30e [Desulfurococcales archaeon]|nr:30S ribosomal protein S30e [Desulfurococcales archaeon]
MPTHGSMTKAGKVRKQTPKIEPKPKKSLPPRLKNRIKYARRVLAPAAAARR